LFVLFIPSKDKNGADIPVGEDQRIWADSAGDLLSSLFGGSTEMPAAKGKWHNEKTNKIITEEIILIHSYAKQVDSEDEQKIGELARFPASHGKAIEARRDCYLDRWSVS
jgi:hypothetical protein